MFFDDAIEGARLLGLTLTSRNKQDKEPVPMCGVPWHQRDTYVARLLRLGHKVAVCEQLEDAAQAKGLVSRGVTEVLTPGSVVAESFLDPAANNFLAASWPTEDALGLCLVDASTSEVTIGALPWDDAAAILAGLRVAEWLVPEGAALAPELQERFERAAAGLPGARTVLAPAAFLETARIRGRWGDGLADRLGHDPAAEAATAAALAYLDRVQGGESLVAPRVRFLADQPTLRVDAASARHLELFQPQPGGEPAHTLWQHVNLTVTTLGARRVRAWLERPLTDLARIAERHDAVERWLEAGVERASFRAALRGLPDLERLASRLALRRATPRDLGALRDALARLPELADRLERGVGAACARTRLASPELAALHERLACALVEDPPPVARDGDIVRAGYDAQRDRLFDLAHSGKRWIADLEREERARTGIGSLKVGFNRVFGYYLEVTRPHLDRVPTQWERRQTLTTAERFVTPELKQKESEVLGAEARLQAIEHELFTALREHAAEFVPQIQVAADALAGLDAEAALAEAAARHGWVRPTLDDSDALALEDARHPVVERLLPRGAFVPNAVALDGRERQILLLTGPNMGGKSTYLRQIALTVLLAQAGSFVPARSARIGIVDRLFTRVGASDRLGAGQSTFMVEMKETAEILRNATPRSLVLLDEIGRGTATYDGLALAWAVTEHLHSEDGPRPRTVFATHYHELTQLADSLPRLRNVHVVVQELGEGVVFLHRIAEGAADRSYGIHVAQRAGLPDTVIERARAVLAELEQERTVDHLRAGTPSRDGAAAEAAGQLPLFGPAVDPAFDELRSLDLDHVTPIEAWRLLAKLKSRLTER
ncbi:MAG: DNA mismatch repair protein MutS [Candidatus Eisenbacteria bacterium]|uniref:DNA mismatch repair protein MutS n=1 Tax=Eiseniibacteriota bacterium TaxID=2212470 RepID=A0A538U2X1_UNCEI|nr:MAG: DNA mismatch repair protein MutS [Candidatus Eisenbacteria bacterium]